MWLVRAVWVTVVFLILTACGHQGPGTAIAMPARTLVASYVVTGITQDGAAKQLVPGSRLQLQFARGSMTATAGCNTMSGGFTLTGNQITVDRLASTEMGCSTALMTQDAWVAGLFAHPVRLGSNNATLTSGNVVLRLADRRTVSPDLPLVGTKWLFDTVYDGATASSVPKSDVAWVEFHRDGNVSVNDGVNDGSGKVHVVGDRISFTELAWTAVGCAGNCAVGNFTLVFNATSTFSITEDRLTLTHGAIGLGFHAVQAFPPRS